MSEEGHSPGEERKCPYCEHVVDSLQGEVAHMEATHPEVVMQRLREAGAMGAELVMDYRNGPDLPSFMTLAELQVVYTLIERLAADEAWDNFRFATDVSILVRDRGPESKIKAPWIEISVGGKQYAIWRNTMALYGIDEHGAVNDDPIFSND